MDSLITAHKKNQENLARIFSPIFKLLFLIGSFFWSVGKIEGIVFAVRRAYWRGRLGNLGMYSDISPNVVVKYPQNLFVGTRSCVGWGSFIDAGGGIKIGDFVLISHLVSINSQSHPVVPPYHETLKAETRIGDHCWIGAGVVIVEGIEIGEGSIVGAGSVVNKNVPPYVVVAGVPAKFIREIPRFGKI